MSKALLVALVIATAASVAMAQRGSSVINVAVAPLSTASGLPSCGSSSKGALYMVTNALTPVALSTVVGGGAVAVLVACDGTNWIVS
jgi:hypothetical protein